MPGCFTAVRLTRLGIDLFLALSEVPLSIFTSEAGFFATSGPALELWFVLAEATVPVLPAELPEEWFFSSSFRLVLARAAIGRTSAGVEVFFAAPAAGGSNCWLRRTSIRVVG